VPDDPPTHDAPTPDAPEARILGNDVEGATPPGYDWPTHGGYLGCLLGLVAGCLIGASLTPPVFGVLSRARIILPGPGFFLVLALVTLASLIVVGRLGYVLGKRFYRYYPQPTPTWGESDASDAHEAGSDEEGAEAGGFTAGDAGETGGEGGARGGPSGVAPSPPDQAGD